MAVPSASEGLKVTEFIHGRGPNPKLDRRRKRGRVGTASECSYIVRRTGTGNVYVMVPDPKVPGRYLRTHPCVAFHACAACNAGVGVPCKGVSGRHVTRVCLERRQTYQRACARALEEAGP